MGPFTVTLLPPMFTVDASFYLMSKVTFLAFYYYYCFY